MNQRRPKNLNLFTIHFPIPAILSILHRITGVFLFLLIPLALGTLSYSLTDQGFDQLKQYLDTLTFKAIFWILFVPFCLHLVAGVRHLLADIHVGDTLKGGRLSAVLVFIITFILIILAGIWLW